MTNNQKKPVRTHWLRWLLLVILCAIIGGVVWRVWFSGGAAGGFAGPGGPGGHGRGGETQKHQGGGGGRWGGMAGGGAASIVHAGVASQADVPVYLSAPGTVIPNASVTVTSRVDGQLEKVYFTEGQKVKAGQLLAQIDDRTYQATLAQYQGALAQNQALLTSARLTLARYRKLFAEDSLSRQDLETQEATTGQYAGAVKEDQAQIDSAKVNIGYARITAPISGRVGLRLIDPGNMVQSSSTTGIVTITQMQPAAVTFSVPQSNIPTLIKALHHGEALPATAFDQNNTTVLAQGEVRFISNSIDTSTGSIEMKATFANQDEALYANQFVNLRLQTSVLKNATVVPVQAVQLSSDGSFVFVINADNTVTRKQITPGPVYGTDKQVVLSGVNPGDRLVTDGIDRLTTGAKVSVATDTTVNSTTTDSAASAAAAENKDSTQASQ
ncbi:MdtA/MuxA family multidrug efflux RND transporter periplasmic adaptor subunit [Tatumella morbirosei]|uniref:MdtA/MuxA family multidrug efflux RND transporter periplasmic adaptor subunit n=1 Tax=Tatumella morbirosei TaxID=642227 RepID=UPI000629EBD3|nr:MdtA/MuxA family multidrug efflux RND transporter periplasmic adaptor subunit [Tatumella morbirosei]